MKVFLDFFGDIIKDLLLICSLQSLRVKGNEKFVSALCYYDKPLFAFDYKAVRT
jgi:hypothetical protein